MTWQKIRIPIPEGISPSARADIGQAMVKLMIEKAQSGVGVRKSGDSFRSRTFPAYTKEYAKRKGQTNVDLTLSGEMLDALRVISHKNGSVLIGFENGSEENAKAEGNILGSYGGDPNPRKARNFLGLLKSEINSIVKEYGE